MGLCWLVGSSTALCRSILRIGSSFHSAWRYSQSFLFVSIPTSEAQQHHSLACVRVSSRLSLSHTHTRTHFQFSVSLYASTPRPLFVPIFFCLGHSSVFRFPRETRSTFAVLVHTIRSLASSLFWYIDTQHTRTQVHTQSVVTRSLIVLFGELWKIGFCV